MTHDEAFLLAIIEDPDDDAPRLVYADWLEEHGQPERAAFIRVQCELAHLPEGDPRRPELVSREWRLLEGHGQEWAWPLREAVSSWEYRRGFIEAVTVRGDAGAARFISQAPALFRLAPIRHLSFRYEAQHRSVPAGLTTITVAEVYSVGPARLFALTRLPEMLHVRTLDLADNELDYRAALVLAAAPNLAGLKSLDLSTNCVGDEGARQIANSPHLKGLEELNLSGGEDRQADWSAIGSTRPNIGDEGALALANSPHLGGLKSLLLYENRLSDEAQQALRARFGGRVKF
jgi:uncharacterized protein (TIGR02996 family)